VTNEPFWSEPRPLERPVPDGDSHENVGVHRSELPNKGMKLTKPSVSELRSLSPVFDGPPRLGESTAAIRTPSE
jgi:hypothetical protein